MLHRFDSLWEMRYRDSVSRFQCARATSVNLCFKIRSLPWPLLASIRPGDFSGASFHSCEDFVIISAVLHISNYYDSDFVTSLDCMIKGPNRPPVATRFRDAQSGNYIASRTVLCAVKGVNAGRSRPRTLRHMDHFYIVTLQKWLQVKSLFTSLHRLS